MNTDNRFYILGVNHAYILAKYQKTLLMKILESKSDSEYFKGLNDGRTIYEQELRAKELDSLRNRSKEKGLER